MKRAPQLPSTTALGISSPGGLAMPPILEQDERSEGKASGEEEPLVPAMESNAAAVGGVPGQPGKSMVNVERSNGSGKKGEGKKEVFAKGEWLYL